MSGERSLLKKMTMRYQELAAEEGRRAIDFENAKKSYYDAQYKRQMYEHVLAAEGVDLKEIVVGHVSDGAGIQRPLLRSEPSGTSEPTKPLSNTHAVFLIMRRYDIENAGMSTSKIEDFAKQDYGLTAEDVAKVIWRQTSSSKALMEKLENGSIRQTAKGLEFNGFRRQKAEG